MFQRWSYTNLFLVVAMSICASWILGYTVPGLSVASHFMTECLFAVAGLGALILGCIGIYATWRHGY
jgi:hypothetical protein